MKRRIELLLPLNPPTLSLAGTPTPRATWGRCVLANAPDFFILEMAACIKPALAFALLCGALIFFYQFRKS
jgi:hypothetical protein